MQIDYIRAHWHMFKDSHVLRNKLEEIATGALPHAGQILVLLLSRTAFCECNPDTTESNRLSGNRIII